MSIKKLFQDSFRDILQSKKDWDEKYPSVNVQRYFHIILQIFIDVFSQIDSYFIKYDITFKDYEKKFNTQSEKLKNEYMTKEELTEELKKIKESFDSKIETLQKSINELNSKIKEIQKW